MAINQINAKGGVDGHRISIKYYDSGVSSEETVTGVQKAIGDHPTAIIGLPVSSGVQAAASVIKASGISRHCSWHRTTRPMQTRSEPTTSSGRWPR